MCIHARGSPSQIYVDVSTLPRQGYSVQVGRGYDDIQHQSDQDSWNNRAACEQLNSSNQ
jgi:hypothetical protein